MSPLIEALFNHTWTVSRRVRSPDGQGGWPLVWTEIGAVAGRLRPAASAERLTADAEESAVTHVFYTLTGEDLTRGDRVEGDGVRVDVLAIREPSRAGHHWEIDAEEVQEEAAIVEVGT